MKHEETRRNMKHEAIRPGLTGSGPNSRALSNLDPESWAVKQLFCCLNVFLCLFVAHNCSHSPKFHPVSFSLTWATLRTENWDAIQGEKNVADSASKGAAQRDENKPQNPLDSMFTQSSLNPQNSQLETPETAQLQRLKGKSPCDIVTYQMPDPKTELWFHIKELFSHVVSWQAVALLAAPYWSYWMQFATHTHCGIHTHTHLILTHHQTGIPYPHSPWARAKVLTDVVCVCIYIYCELDVPLNTSVVSNRRVCRFQWSTRGRRRHGFLLLELCSMGSWAKRTSSFVVPWRAGKRLYTWGIHVMFLLCPHSHPPRMTDFISHAQESRFKVPHSAFTLIELWRVESSHRGLLCLHLSIQWHSAYVHDIEIHPLRRCRQLVSDMHDVSYKGWKWT